MSGNKLFNTHKLIVVLLIMLLTLNCSNGFAANRQPGTILAIDKVYPFSDFNKLMDLAEMLQARGINFIVTVMPVYDNYELEAFDTYIRVLKYVQKMGGTIFISYPVENEDGTYNLNPKTGFAKAVTEFRRRGLDIRGTTLPMDKLINKNYVFEGLNLPFILVTEGANKIKPQDFQQISELSDYVIIHGVNIDDFDYFPDREMEEKTDQVKRQAVYISLEDEEKLLFLLKVFDKEGIRIEDFYIHQYPQLPELSVEVNQEVDQQREKTEIERFMEKEMIKIKGENVQQERVQPGYDLSRVTGIAIKVAAFIFVIMLVQMFVSRYYGRKKFFKD